MLSCKFFVRSFFLVGLTRKRVVAKTIIRVSKKNNANAWRVSENYYICLTNYLDKTMTIYDYIVKDAKGNSVKMSEYKGKVLLIVNTATDCGFTPQYEGLQNLYDQYKHLGFEILDFPCNQFMNQSPLGEDEIQKFCSLKYRTTFRLFKKIEVNGPNAEPLFGFLKSEHGGFLASDIKWNFTKFLVDRNGNVVERFEPQDKPKSFEADIANLLK